MRLTLKVVVDIRSQLNIRELETLCDTIQDSTMEKLHSIVGEYEFTVGVKLLNSGYAMEADYNASNS